MNNSLPSGYKPTDEEAQFYIEINMSNIVYITDESSLVQCFGNSCPSNTSRNDVLCKCALLNALYNTHIIDIRSMAKHITQIPDIEMRMSLGDLSLVNEIAKVNNRSFYSFASKYCSHCEEEKFPIYDRFVDRCLRFFRDNGYTCQFSNHILKSYPTFVSVYNDFIARNFSRRYTYKEMDHYLWQLGKYYMGDAMQKYRFYDIRHKECPFGDEDKCRQLIWYAEKEHYDSQSSIHLYKDWIAMYCNKENPSLLFDTLNEYFYGYIPKLVKNKYLI